jgi:FKBP-type peptidyl-prolyl cis-trans isomerase
MVSKSRLFAGFGAVLFLVTSSALTIVVILSSNQNSSSSTASTSLKTTVNCPNGFNVATGSKLQGFTPIKQPLTHLAINDINKGKGAVVKSGATVSACYVGALASSGTVFGDSGSQSQTFSLNGVILGWQLGIPGMKVGGTRELLIPSSMGYGKTAQTNIPANSDLVFIVTIESVQG